MNREIKSRAQTSPKYSRTKWVYGDFFSQYRDGVTSYYIVEHPNGRDGGREIMWPVNPDTVGQYTGLKDKNGVEIYEGDILKEKKRPKEDTNRITDVRWHPDSGCYALHQGDSFSSVLYAYKEIVKDCQVIGNIYENPELLK